MAAGKRTLQVEILGEVRGLKKSLTEAGGHLQNFGSKFDSLKKITGAALGAIGAQLSVQMVADLFKAGAEAEAFGRRYQTVFQDAGGALDQFVEDQASRFGLTNSQMQGLAAQVGDLLVPMGYTRDRAAAITEEVLNTANALSEWSGGARTAQETTDIIIKGILGEREGLKQLGVQLSQADIDARTAQEGMQGLTGEAKRQYEAMTTLALIQERSADALTAYGKNAGGAQQAAKEFQAALAELKESAGELVVKLAPAVSLLADLIGLLTGDIPQLDFSNITDPEIAARLAEQRSRFDQINQAMLDLGQQGGVSVINFWDTVEYAEGMAAQKAEEWMAALKRGDMAGAEAARNASQYWADYATALGQVEDATGEAEDATGDYAAAMDRARPHIRAMQTRLEQLNDATGRAVREMGESFGELPDLIEEHGGDVQDAIAAVLEIQQQKIDFQRNLQELSAAGLGEIVTMLTDSPESAATYAAAEELANGIGTAYNTDLNSQLRENRMILAGLMLPPDVTDAWRRSGSVAGNAFATAALQRLRDALAQAAAAGTGHTYTIGGRQHGGPVSRNRAYVVGETGPELFVPNTAGKVVPETAVPRPLAAASSPIHVHVDLDGRQIAQAIVTPMSEELDRYRRSRS